MTTEAIAETTAAIEIDTEAIIAKYGGLKIPDVTMIMMAVTVLILVAAIVFGFVFLSRHYGNFSNGIFIGIIAELAFGYLVYGLITYALTKIPGPAAYFEAHKTFYSIIQVILSIICEGLAVFLGMKYLMRLNQKRGIYSEVSAPLTMGLSMCAASVLVGQELTFAVEFIMISLSVNSIGVENAVYQMLASGTEEAVVESTIMGMVNTSWSAFFWDGISFLLKGLAEISAAVMVYGVCKERLDKKWTLGAFGVFVLYYLPSLINNAVTLPTWALVIIAMVITATVVFIAGRLIYAKMPEDWDSFKRKPVKRRRQQKKEEEEKEKKMPKIVMPDD